MVPIETRKEFLDKKIVSAREAAGFSITEAAQKLGFKNYQTLSAIEKGVRKVNAHELIMMARLYGRNLDYFLDSDIVNDPIPLWRKTKRTDINQVQRQFLSFLENYSNLEHLLGLKRRWKDVQKNYDRDDFSVDGFEQADKLGAEIHNYLDLGSRPSFNLLNVLENKLRFKILHLSLGDGISGASVVDNTLGVGILINAKDVPWRRNFDLAHELFHVITWNVFSPEEIGNGQKKTRPEQYADIFASSLLLPEAHLLDILKETVTDNKVRLIDIIELAKDFGVSTEAILWRLVNLKVLKKSQAQKFLDNPDFHNVDRNMRRRLYDRDRPSKFPSRFISLACRSLMEGKISRGTFAEYLEIDRAEIDAYLNDAGFVEENYAKIAAA
ncbi:MAG: ImmA/IrrE family metallo-endopeptidase [Deltaproteobacteria bacterium]|nr:ImmA/IrrE family metallo-endopeptidase [Deltaproteobacteria bacterium]MBW2119156.1 ImmA/IrrE family metallo-endopeptidase [Deltaproteobacteria bacterium]MBW2344366.1 ImmA/IrrE family metallo-endopeptidase [Deltaproteobacteria bacterium]